MNKLIALAPFALLTTACAVRTPASALDVDRGDALPSTFAATLPSEAEVMAAWQLPPSIPWSRYEKLTLLTYLADHPALADMPDVGNLEVVRRAELAAARLSQVGLPPGTLWIVDLRGAASVAFGASLSRHTHGRVAPVMTFNNWPAEDEVVPAEQTLAALATMRPVPIAPSDEPPTPVFLLDAWRLALRDREPDPEAVDNRYMLLPSDFPDAATLRAAGITRVVYVVEDRGESSTEEDDFHEVALDWQNAGIGMALIDLRAISTLGGSDTWVAEPAWDLWLDESRLVVQERFTIFDDVRFYQRARGGFGGVRAAPARARGYTPAQPTYAGHGLGGGGRTYSRASPHVSGHGGG